jgi:hypothetical protein
MDHRTAPRFGQHLGALAAQLLHARSDRRKVVSGARSVALADQAGFESVLACEAHHAGWTSCLERFVEQLSENTAKRPDLSQSPFLQGKEIVSSISS